MEAPDPVYMDIGISCFLNILLCKKNILNKVIFENMDLENQSASKWNTNFRGWGSSNENCKTFSPPLQPLTRTLKFLYQKVHFSYRSS